PKTGALSTELRRHDDLHATTAARQGQGDFVEGIGSRVGATEEVWPVILLTTRPDLPRRAGKRLDAGALADALVHLDVGERAPQDAVMDRPRAPRDRLPSIGHAKRAVA